MKNLSGSDFRLLKIFMAVAKCRGITPAQAELDLSVSSISNYLSSLETRIGVRLCNRGRRGFELTDEGKIIYEQAKRLFTAADSLTSVAGELKGRLAGVLNIGLVDCLITDDAFPLPKAIAKFSERKNEVDIRVTTHTPADLMQATFDGQLDLSIGYFSQKIESLKFKPLYLEHQSVYCSKTHELFDRIDISKDTLKHYAFSTVGYLKKFDADRVGSLNIMATTDNIEGQAVAILSGKYVGILPQHFAKRWVDCGELQAILPDQLDYSAKIMLAMRQQRSHSLVVTAFIEDLNYICELLTKSGIMTTHKHSKKTNITG